MTDRAAFPLARLLVLAGATFASISSEFLPTGILPQIARELRVSESQIGALVTVFALTVVVSTVPLTALTRTLSRKRLMVLMLAGLALTNLVCALAPDYGVLAAARVLGGLCHGLFWAVTGPYAALLVRPEHLARALSVANVGGTLAFILGVPVGTAIGVALGWRAAFGVMGALVLAFAVLVALFLPPVDHRVPLRTGEVAIAASRDRSLPGVLLVSSIVLVFATGQYVFYTYIAPWLTGVAHVDPGAVSGMLFGYGVAGAAGLLLVGIAGDRAPRASLVVVVAGVGASVALLALIGHSPIPALVGLLLWSAFFAGYPALMQARMLRTASPRIRDLAAAMIAVSFNVAIGGGALLGGVVLDRVGLAALPWTQVGFCVAALALVLVALVWLPGRRGVRSR